MNWSPTEIPACAILILLVVVGVVYGIVQLIEAIV